MTTAHLQNIDPPMGIRQRKFLFVASTGGHLAQLARLAEGMNASEDSMWLTFDTEQSRSLLAGRRVRYVPYIASRDLKGVLVASAAVRDLLKSEHFDEVVSTGAALALSAMPLAKARRIPTLYIESVSRINGPSLTGRIIAGLRLARLRTQHQGWASSRWQPYPSVLSQFEPESKTAEPATQAGGLKIFVTLGTIRPYRFDSLVDALLATGLCSENTTWQLGVTSRAHLPGVVVEQATAQEFERLCRQADVVVTHSGVGTILNLLEAGVHPVVVPRRKSRREHVDDHQLQIAQLVSGLGVATVAEADELRAEHLIRASRLRTMPVNP